MFRILLYYTQDRRRLKVTDKLVHIFLVTQVVASWEEGVDLKLVVKRALVPQVLAETSLSSKLSVVWEMIVPLLVCEFVQIAFFIRDIELDVEALAG